MIEKQYYIRVDYEPHTEDKPEQDGTFRIMDGDEVEERVMSKDSRIVHTYGTPASSPYYECVVSTLLVAEHIEKFIIQVLTLYKYRVME